MTPVHSPGEHQRAHPVGIELADRAVGNASAIERDQRIVSVNRMISGEELKQRIGLSVLLASTALPDLPFALTVPLAAIKIRSVHWRYGISRVLP